MGYRGAENWTIGQNWNVQKYYDTILSEVVCGEDNTRIGECAYKTLDSSDCNIHQDVFLSCISNKGSHWSIFKFLPLRLNKDIYFPQNFNKKS